MNDKVNTGGLVRLLSSSKGLIFLGVVTAGMVLALTNHLPGDVVYAKIINLAMIYFPATAIEDAARNLSSRPSPSPVAVNVQQTVPPPPAVPTIEVP